MLISLLEKCIKRKPSMAHLINIVLVVLIFLSVTVVTIFSPSLFWLYVTVGLWTLLVSNYYLKRLILLPLAKLTGQLHQMKSGKIVTFDKSEFRTSEVTNLADHIKALNCSIDSALQESLEAISLNKTYGDDGINGLNPTERLRFDISMLRKVLEVSRDMIYVKDSESRLVLVNQNLVRLYPGCTSQDLLGTTSRDWFEDQNHVDAFIDQDKIAFEEGLSDVYETIKMPDGSVKTLHSVKTRFYDANGQPFILCVSSDETDRQALIDKLENANEQLDQSYQQVREMAETDPLTGLYNRYYFDETLEITVKSAPDDMYLALMLIDVDHFKHINDTYGHETGDKVLISFAKSVSSLLDDSMMFARIGGDEFGIIIPNLESPKPAIRLAQHITEGLPEVSVISSADQSVSITLNTSIGIAFFPKDAFDCSELKRFADIAMYRAKRQGRKQFCLFEDSMQKQFSNSFRIESELRTALDNNAFDLHFQPIFSPCSNELQGFEALLRWPDMYPPDVFIPIAEETKQILDIGVWVLETAIRQLSEWNKQVGKKLSVSVNMSPIQLEDTMIPERIAGLLNKYDVEPSQLIIEITETALLRRSSSSFDQVHTIQEIGCKVALDDFGTGFSSLSHLVDFTVDKVKLDKTMLPTSENDIRVHSVFEGLVLMLKKIGLRITAEGIETSYQHKLCHSLQIEEVQGYYYARPKKASEFNLEFLSNT